MAEAQSAFFHFGLKFTQCLKQTRAKIAFIPIHRSVWYPRTIPEQVCRRQDKKQGWKGNAQEQPGLTFHSSCLRTTVVLSSLVTTMHFCCCCEERHCCSLQLACYLWNTTFFLIHSSFSQNTWPATTYPCSYNFVFYSLLQ